MSPARGSAHLAEDAFAYYPRLARVREWVEGNLSEEITLGDAARVACLERKYFSTYFRSKVGVPFSSWLVHRRVRRATAILASRDCSIAEVAAWTGFGSTRSFQRHFRAFTGITPRQFKGDQRPSESADAGGSSI